MLKHAASLLCVVLCPLLVLAADGEPDWNKLLRMSDVAAQTEWGQRYEHGEGVAQDYAKAIKLYCAAANRGYALAQYQLGWIYANGRGIDRDDSLAGAWFKLAAAKGDSYAQRMLEQIGTGTVAKKAKCVVPNNGGLDDLQLAGVPSPQRRQVEQWVRQLAPAYGLDPALVLLVIQAESGFNHRARSPKDARGLMQLIPATARRFGVENPWDPLQNLRGGMAYLRWLLAYFQGDVRLVLAGYNAGESAVEKYRGVPPYAETRSYVARITRAYGQTYHPAVTRVVAPSAIFAQVKYGYDQRIESEAGGDGS